jgi:hypothetical protein
MPLRERRVGSQGDGSARLWFFGLLLVTASSWARWIATGSPKVDQNYPSRLAGTLVFVLLLGGWSLLIVGWRGLLDRPPERPRRLAYAALAVASCMLPMISNDVFSLFAYGSSAARGQDIYTTASGLYASVWHAWMGEPWSAKVCVYGPLTLLALLPVALAGKSFWLALFLLRLTWLPPLVLVMELSFRRFRCRPSFYAMVWLNPLWIVEGPGQLHADLLGLVVIVLGLLFSREGRAKAGWVAYALAVFSKYSFAFTGPWFWLCEGHASKSRSLRLFGMAIVVAAVGVLVFAPFWRGAATLTEPLRTLAGMNPGGSITEVIGTVVDVVRGGSVPRADTPVTLTLDRERVAREATWFVVSLVLRLVTLGIGSRILWKMLRSPYDEDRIAVGTGALVVAVATLASHRFQSWYLLAALPFFGLRCTAVWRRWWVAAVALSVSTEFVHVLSRRALLLPLWSVATNTGVVLVFLMSFRARYFWLDDAPREATAPVAR